ncbi:hypothetical protein CGRA01v4_08689 [Colletotrichum graminicola]|nr:hypothetical protein CGRA01v4_08689 [Colletotrichum graminicola]
MDPLSISASVIALVQSSLAVGKGVKLLASLRHAPAEFCDLVNELTTLQAVIEQVKNPLEELESERASDRTLPDLDTSATLVLKRDLEIIAEELGALCERLTSAGKTRRIDQAGCLKEDGYGSKTALQSSGLGHTPRETV